MALTLRLDLADVLRDQFSDEQKRAVSSLIRSDTIKREFGQRCINEIIDRTNNGLDKNSSAFTPYSKAYRKSREFRIYGKSSRVNLKLSGEMHASIGILSTGSTSVTIAIPGGGQEVKARGHINGSGPLPVRDFWGISLEDQGRILKDVLKNQNAEENLEVINEMLANVAPLIGALNQESGERESSVSLSILSLLNLDEDDG